MNLRTLIALLIVGAPALAQPPADELQPGQSPPVADPGTPPAPTPPVPGEQPANQLPAIPGEPLANVSGTPEAKAIFHQMVDAFQRAKGLTFHAKVVNTGSLAGRTADTDVSITMRRPPDKPGMWQIRVSGSATRKAEDPAQQIDVSWGPSGVHWIDHAAKQLIERSAVPGSGPLVQAALNCIPTDYIDRPAFTREMRAQSVTLDGAEQVDGVECQILSFQYQKGSSLNRIWIASSDHLIRRYERANTLKNYSSSTVMDFTEVQSHDGLPDELFTLELPDGYDRVQATSSVFRRANTASPGGAASPAGTPVSTATPATSTAPPPPPPKPEGPPPAPTFEATTVSGEKLSLDTLKGSVTILFFWGTWSLPGTSALDEVQKLVDDKSSPPVRALALAVRERSRSAPADYAKQAGITLPIVPDGETVAAIYTVTIYPTWVVIDPAGGKVGTVEGFKKDVTLEKVRALISKARGEPPPTTEKPADPTGTEKPQ